MTIATELNHTQLFSDAARERVGTMGQRRWGGGSATMPIKYTFEGGFPDPGTFPMEALADVTRRVLMTDRTALNYDFVGYGGMREVVIELERPHGGNLPKHENILITAGASQAAIRQALPEVQRTAERHYLRVCPVLAEKHCPGVEPLLVRLIRHGVLLGLEHATPMKSQSMGLRAFRSR